MTHFLLKNTIKIVSALIFIAFLAHCAKVGTITGGAKDVKPPVVLGSEPKQYVTNFRGNKITVDFDEYIKLKDFTQQFNVSPPFKKRPKVYINNKSVIITYKDTLRDSTTYTMNFGNSLRDNNEDNILENFEFVFSTTSYIDSMGVQGYVIDAFTGKPGKLPFLVCLYANLSDTAPFTQQPVFTGRSYKDGVFHINNVKNGIYRLYAFQDNNNNLKYDPVGEVFAYADTLAILNPEFLSSVLRPQKLLDSLQAKQDSLFAKKDYLVKSDTIKKEIAIDKNKLMIELYTFNEKSAGQFIKNYLWKEKRKLTTVFNNALIDDSINIKPVLYDYENWYHKEVGPKKDSIIYWITDTNLLKLDSLRCIISYQNIRENGDTAWMADTVKFVFSETGNNKRKKENDTIVEKMKFNFETSGTLDLNAVLRFETVLPISEIDLTRIELKVKSDTIYVPSKIDLQRDSVFPRKFSIKNKWEEQSKYRLLIYPGAFQNIYNVPHDTLELDFTTQKAEYYGKFSVRIFDNDKKGLIVQLLAKDQLAYEKYISGNGTVDFEYLKPGTYTLKAIFDDNFDKQYTSGNFLLKRQAERVSLYKEALTVRSNWENTIDWAPVK